MGQIKVYTPGGLSYTLHEDDEIYRGGEGRIMLIRNAPQLVAKIYHKGIQPLSREQYRYLSQLDPHLFVAPQELLLSCKKEILGFTMPYLDKDYFPLSAIFSKIFCARNNINEVFKKKLADKLIRAVEYAHQHQVVIGDLNQYNILINTQGDLRLIDTDSYETPAHQHAGLLLEDIRDYLHGGHVNRQSDFFALSVLLFYSFTFTHPFKGIHKKYKGLAERMINRLPVFVDDPDLKKPKCYMPIRATALQQQFEKFYINGERFLLSLSGLPDMLTVPKAKVTVGAISQQDLLIKPIVEDTNIQQLAFNQNLGYIETDTVFIIYDARNKTYLLEKFRIEKAQYPFVYLSDNHVFVRRGQRLFHYKSPADVLEIANYRFPEDAIVAVFDQILLVVDHQTMSWLYLNDVLNQSVRNKRHEVFGAGFSGHSGLVQHTGGINRIFYNTGKDMAIVKTDVPLKAVVQKGPVGIVQYIDNKKVKHNYFYIDGLRFVRSDKDVEHLKGFTYRPTADGQGYIFEPANGQINIRRSLDFELVSTLACDLISEYSSLYSSSAGILAWEERAVYLLNKR